MRACLRANQDPWAWNSYDLQKRLDILNYDEIASYDEVELRTELAKLQKGIEL